MLHRERRGFQLCRIAMLSAHVSDVEKSDSAKNATDCVVLSNSIIINNYC
jgi:hypothetical protein